MFEDLEKAFDTAFFNANHQLKQVHQVIANFEDVITEDHVGTSLSTISTQLSTMAFCFAQLMCKSILFSENYFILKVFININILNLSVFIYSYGLFFF